MTQQTWLTRWGRVLPYMDIVEATCKHRAAGFFAAVLVPLLALALLPAVAAAQQGLGYLWANNPTAASYTPSSTYAYNPASGAISITRAGIGQYTATFQNFGGQGRAGSNVQVTAYGGYNEYCKAYSWDSSGTDFLVSVRCFTPAGSPVDTRFDAQAIWPTVGAKHGFAWANQPSAVSYTPSSTYAFNSANGPITITRSRVGLYAVRFANLGGNGVDGGNVQVTAYGSDSAHCKVSSWNSAGSDFVANVSCFTATGTPVDTYYSVRAIRVMPCVAYAWCNKEGTGCECSAAVFGWDDCKDFLAKCAKHGIAEYRCDGTGCKCGEDAGDPPPFY